MRSTAFVVIFFNLSSKGVVVNKKSSDPETSGGNNGCN